jgi:hypothetical protein
MRVHLTARDRKVLAVGTLICTALIAGTRGLPALVRWTHGARATAVQLGAEAARVSNSVTRASVTRDTLAAENERYLALAARLLDQETPAGAGSSLASLLSDAAAESNVKLGSVQIHADTTFVGAFMHVTVRADLTGDIRGLAAMLAMLEKDQTLLTIRAMSISQPEPAAGDDRAEVLRAEVVVEGLMPSTRGRGSR